MTGKRLLLHLCCAPDGTVPWPALVEEGYAVEGFFYGSNIHPQEEYCLRLEAVRSLVKAQKGVFHGAPYDPDRWLEAVGEWKDEPEGGKRCLLCFRLQLEAAADFAAEREIPFLATTLTISPHKDVAAINAIGAAVASSRGLSWVSTIWRKGGGFTRSVAESRRLGLYRQNYCGCLYSRRGDDSLEKD
jgi:hypothetical protein